jgi:transcriptional regulator with XRE-family HTH domain
VVKWTTIRRLDTWGDDVAARLAARGLRQQDLAADMGVTSGRLSLQFSQATVTEDFFLRVTRALGMQPEDWDTPLPRAGTTRDRARLRRRNVRNAGKVGRPGKPDGSGETGC